MRTPHCCLLCPPGATSRTPCRRRAQPGSALRGATSTALQSTQAGTPLHPECGRLPGRIESGLVRQPWRPASQPACLVPAPTCPAPARPQARPCVPHGSGPALLPTHVLPPDPTEWTRVSSSNPSCRPGNRGPGSESLAQSHTVETGHGWGQPQPDPAEKPLNAGTVSGPPEGPQR